jgi:hypothetical protein
VGWVLVQMCGLGCVWHGPATVATSRRQELDK